jgi:hypothetical protein
MDKQTGGTAAPISQLNLSQPPTVQTQPVTSLNIKDTAIAETLQNDGLKKMESEKKT